MELLTGDQMRAIDRGTIDQGRITGLELMERAGRGLLRSILLRGGPLHRRRIVIVCGKGNNGGDGLVLARLLRNRGLWPDVVLALGSDALAGDAAENARRAARAGCRLRAGTERERSRLALLREDDLIVDALLGTGLAGPARDPAAAWIEAMNGAPGRRVAVDLPSGLSGDHGRVEGPAVRAAWTVTMGHPKLGLLFPPGRELAGPIDVIDLGYPDEIARTVPAAASLPEPAELAELLPRRTGGTHKGDWGKLLVVGGSPGLTGAPTLAARAALRTGAGLVRIGVPRSLQPVAAGAVTEAMTLGLPEGESGQLLRVAAESILSKFGDWDALVLGPGLGRFPECERLVLSLLGGWRGPLLVDADGLNALAAWGPDSWVPRAREIRAAGEPGRLVLTPHAGEMSRLTGRPVTQLKSDPVGQAREWARRWGVTLVLKGAPTVVASPEGNVAVNPTGNSGLSTGGAGDVLSGMIGALLGQGLTGPAAALVGTYLHGAAADEVVAAWERGAEDEPRARRSLLPTDVIEALPAAIGRLERRLPPPFWNWRLLP